MFVTPDNAPKLLGKTLDATKRMLGIYPYKVIQFPSGMYATVDSHGVASPVSNNQLSQVYFDMVDGQYIESEEELENILEDMNMDKNNFAEELEAEVE